MKHVGEAALVLPFRLPHDNVAYNNRGHESFLPRAKVDEPVKSRHTGENRCPVFCNHLESLDSGFHRNDDCWTFSTFYETVKVEWTGIFICHRLILVVTPLARLKQ